MNIASTPRIMAVCAGIGLLIFSACNTDTNKGNVTNTDTPTIVTVAVPSHGGQQDLNISGQVEAGRSANISTRVMGYITGVKVKVGDHVGKGQLLATISNQDILAKKAQADAMISEADAACKNAQKDYERFTALYKQQSASAKELDNITLQYTAAKARLEAAKQMRNEVVATLNYTNLTAPFAGVVTQKLADAGSIANPGMPILTIEESGSYQVGATVPENAINQVRQGAAVTITVGAVNKTIKGTIAQVSQSSQFSGSQYEIKIQIPDHEKQGLFAGMYANILVPVQLKEPGEVNNNQVMVPLSCIVHKDELTGLYTVGNNNTALLRWVRLGKVQESQVEVLSGLAAGEPFILSAEGRLFNGAVVNIKR